MLDVFMIITGILSLVSVGTLLLKSRYKNNDISIWGAIIARTYLLVFSILPVIYNSIDVEYFFSGVALVIFTDIILNVVFFTTRKYKEEIQKKELIKQLERLNSKYMLIVENSLVGFYVINDSGVFEYVNPRLCDILGYTKEELINKSVYEIISPEYHELVRANIESRISGLVDTLKYSVTAKRKDGRVISVEIMGSKTRNGHTTISGFVLKVEGVC